jgi:hypothetical protein
MDLTNHFETSFMIVAAGVDIHVERKVEKKCLENAIINC